MFSFRKILLIFTSAFIVSAQSLSADNAFGIDEECYAIYRRAESAIGEAEFRMKLDSLRFMSIEKGDTKAETLSYVLELRDLKERNDYDGVMNAHDVLKSVAQRTGYMQYYFFSYDLVETFLYNRHDHSGAIRMAKVAIEDAHRLEDDYGVYSSSRFIARVYRNQYDYLNSRRYIRQALEVLESSNNPSVTSQNGAPLMIDMAATFEPGSDSCSFYVDEALDRAKNFYDSLRISYFKATNGGIREGRQAYEKYRNLCLPYMKNLTTYHKSAQRIFDRFDMFFADRKAPLDSLLNGMSYEDVRYIIALLSANGRLEDALDAEHIYIDGVLKAISDMEDSKIETAGAAIGNLDLTLKLLRRTRSILYISLVFFSIIIILLLYFFFKLRKAKRNAEAANEMKTKFVQNMSHEVRTPLNAIVGFAQLLSLPDGFLTEAEKNEYGEYIRNNSEMLTMLINDTLDLSDITHDHFSVNLSDAPVNQICRSSMKCVEVRLPAGLEFRFDTDAADDFTVRTDPMRVQQVLVNYLTNAFKHTKTGSVVVSVSLAENPGNVTFAVTDTGEGIPPEDAEIIFQRFIKLNEFVAGSGLGLNIVSLIAGKLGSTACLDTSYTGGARFLFIIPIEA